MRFKNYILIIFSVALTFCSSNKEQDIFKEASELLKTSDYDGAITKFEEIVNDYPKSAQADSSLFEIAKLYQGQVIKNFNPDESLKKSVEAYKRIFTDYPDSKLAESSVFMTAFILANDLRDLQSAEKMYKLYLEKYPKGELADDAKIELQNLGKTPEEILNSRTSI